MKEIHVVLGTGPVGRFTAEKLTNLGKSVRMVNRSGQMADPIQGVEIIKANVTDPTELRGAVQGAQVVYQCAQPPYDKWPELFPLFQQRILEATRDIGASLVLAENLYAYGDTQGQPLTEKLPLKAEDKKGYTRARMIEAAYEAHAKGQLKVTSARASDFYGPWALEQSALGARSLLPLLSGKPALMMGNVDLPHTYTYVKDFGTALAILGTSEQSWGKAWHVPSDRPDITPREVLQMAAELTGTSLKIKAMRRPMMSVLSLFIPILREILPLSYQFEKPYILDSSAMQQVFGMKPTPLRQALQETITWIKSHS